MKGAGQVSADGVGVVSNAGAGLLREMAEETGLLDAVTAALIDTYRQRPVHAPGRVFTDLAVAVVALSRHRLQRPARRRGPPAVRKVDLAVDTERIGCHARVVRRGGCTCLTFREDTMDLVLGLAGFILGIAGIVATIYYERKSARLNKLRKRLEWADLQSAANDLAQRINRDYTPAAIVTPGLRGATFANLLASEFVGQPPVYVGISTWKDSEHGEVLTQDSIEFETKKWLVSVPSAPTRYPDGTILIVDDFAMSGDFLDQLKQSLIDAGLPERRICSVTIAATKVAVKNHKAPDYYWWLADDDDFFFPWGKAR